jgi:hypothetical protein
MLLREDLMKRGSFLREQMRTDLKGAVKNERREKLKLLIRV